MVVNQVFARRYFGDRNPVGHSLGLGNEPGTPTDFEIIGAARDSKFYRVRKNIRPLIYFDNRTRAKFRKVRPVSEVR